VVDRPENVIDSSPYFELVWRRLWLILAVFVLVVVGALLVSLKMTPIYEAATTLRIEQRSPKIMTSINEVTPMGMGDYASYRDYYETQYKLIMSKSLIVRVLQLPVLKNYGTQFHEQPAWKKALKELLGINRRNSLTPQDRAAAKLMKALRVKPVINSQLVKIYAQDPDPETAVLLANSMAEEYVKQNLERSVNAADAASRWLTNAVEEQRAKLQKAQKALETYERDHNMNLLTQTSGASSVEEIKSELTKRQAEYDSLSERYTDEHPKMIELKSQINSLRNKIEGLKEVDTGNKSMEYRVLEEEVQANRRMHEALLARYKEIDLSGSLNMNNITVVDRAELPNKPVKPNVRKNMILAILAGLFLGYGLAYIVDFLDRTVRSTEDVKKLLKAHFLGAIHSITGLTDEIGRDRITYMEFFSPASESYRAIRTDILNILGGDGMSGSRAILVTSAEPRAGKTMTITNLAIVFAQQGYRVLLVDCDLRKPQIHRIFQKDQSKGIGDYLMEQATFQEILRDTDIENLKIVTSGTGIQNPAEMIGTLRMEQFIRDAKEKFHYIFVDSPPVMSVTDSVVLADKVDAAVQVVRSGKSSIHAALRVKELLGRAKAKILGVILNDLNAHRGGYGYYYNYKYYHYYGSNNKSRRSSILQKIKK